jgi:hypothetical protein
MFGKLAPKPPEVKPPEEIPRLEQGGELGKVRRTQGAENLALDVLKSKYPKAEDSYLLGVSAILGVGTPSPDLSTAIRAGYNKSLMGRRGVALGYKQDYKLDAAQYEAMSEPVKFAYSLASFIGDVPGFAFGGAVGATVGGPVGAIGGAFGFTEGLRSYYDQLIEKGEVKGPRDFLSYVNTVAKEELKGIATGKVMEASGKLGKEAAGAVGKLLAEAGALTAVPAALEARLPTAEDYYNTASFLLGLNLIIGLEKIPIKLKKRQRS